MIDRASYLNQRPQYQNGGFCTYFTQFYPVIRLLFDYISTSFDQDNRELNADFIFYSSNRLDIVLIL